MTAMQELIERFEKRKKDSKAFHELLFFDAVISEATDLLAKEREQIVDAYADGWISDSPDAEQYYSSKYEQK